MAWFTATPEDKKTSRWQQIQTRGGTPLMPPMEDESYLFVIWQQTGMTLQGFNGPCPLSASELMAWSVGVSRPLGTWEFSTILSMSRLYCSKFYEANSKDCPPPYGNPVNDFDRAKVANDIRNKFGAFMKAKKR